jgi:hypothetical protein
VTSGVSNALVQPMSSTSFSPPPSNQQRDTSVGSLTSNAHNGATSGSDNASTNAHTNSNESAYTNSSLNATASMPSASAENGMTSVSN